VAAAYQLRLKSGVHLSASPYISFRRARARASLKLKHVITSSRIECALKINQKATRPTRTWALGGGVKVEKYILPILLYFYGKYFYLSTFSNLIEILLV
jgi:hypothetical protein